MDNIEELKDLVNKVREGLTSRKLDTKHEDVVEGLLIVQNELLINICEKLEYLNNKK